MLPKENKITRELFDRLLKKSTVSNGKILSVRRHIDASLSKSHFSVVVSKKVAPHAVDRNKIKRRIYAALRTILPNLSNLPNTPSSLAWGLYVVFPKKGALTIPYKALQEELTELMVK